jgi:hypothetical protein
MACQFPVLSYGDLIYSGKSYIMFGGASLLSPPSDGLTGILPALLAVSGVLFVNMLYPSVQLER